VVIDDLVERITRPDSLARSKQNLHVAMPKPNGLPNCDGKKTKRKGGNDSDRQPVRSSQSR
jgi:hypothetical protein